MPNPGCNVTHLLLQSDCEVKAATKREIKSQIFNHNHIALFFGKDTGGGDGSLDQNFLSRPKMDQTLWIKYCMRFGKKVLNRLSICDF